MGKCNFRQYKDSSLLNEFIISKVINFFLQSYGGFTTSHVIGHPTDTFTCGMAMAPVTNFRYYCE